MSTTPPPPGGEEIFPPEKSVPPLPPPAQSPGSGGFGIPPIAPQPASEGFPPPPSQSGAFPPPPSQSGAFPPSFGTGQEPGGYVSPVPGGTGVPVRNPKALLSVVLGVAGLFCFGVVLGAAALFLGFTARKEIDASGGQQTGRGLATAGMVLGAIAFFSFFLVMLLGGGSPLGLVGS